MNEIFKVGDKVIIKKFSIGEIIDLESKYWSVTNSLWIKNVKSKLGKEGKITCSGITTRNLSSPLFAVSFGSNSDYEIYFPNEMISRITKEIKVFDDE